MLFTGDTDNRAYKCRACSWRSLYDGRGLFTVESGCRDRRGSCEHSIGEADNQSTGTSCFAYEGEKAEVGVLSGRAKNSAEMFG